jgi:hypothetical protein
MNVIVNGWHVRVEQTGQKKYSQISINHLKIPDDVFLVVKDYLYFNGIEVNRKFYKFAVNSSNLRMTIMNPRFLSNSLGLPRLVYWVCLLTDDWKQQFRLQRLTCIDYEEPAKLNSSYKHDALLHLANNEELKPIVEVNMTVDINPDDNLSVASIHASLQTPSNHSAQWSIISNDNQHYKDFDEWDNDGQDFGYDSVWYAESRDV